VNTETKKGPAAKTAGPKPPTKEFDYASTSFSTVVGTTIRLKRFSKLNASGGGAGLSGGCRQPATWLMAAPTDFGGETGEPDRFWIASVAILTASASFKA